MEKPLPDIQMFTRVITSILRRGHHASACANCRLEDDSDETNLSRGLSGNRILPAIFPFAMLRACGDNSNAPDSSSRSVSATPNGFGIEVELKTSLPGTERPEAQALIDKAHVVCPYSNATRNDIDAKPTLI
jgi:hypothetical protein